MLTIFKLLRTVTLLVFEAFLAPSSPHQLTHTSILALGRVRHKSVGSPHSLGQLLGKEEII